jgi:hypothetical protein
MVGLVGLLEKGGFTFYDIFTIHLMRVSHSLYLLKERMLSRKEGERLTGHIHSL